MKHSFLGILMLCTLYIAYGQDRGHNSVSVSGTGALPFMADVSLLNVNRYAAYFLKNNEFDLKYELASTDFDYYDRVAALGGDDMLVDIPLEIALLSYSAGVIDIRPAQAIEMLPADNPKQADLKLGSAVFQELQVLRFLGASTGSATSTAAVGRYEGMLKFITDRKNVTRAEIEAHYRDGIRAFIADIVTEEFNEMRFFIENIINKQASSYSGVLTRNSQTGQYTLRYASETRNIRKELSAQTPGALLSAMSASRDFSGDAVNFVRTQAAMLPAVAMSASERDGLINLITAFYLNPNRNTANAVTAAYRDLINGDEEEEFAADSFARAIYQLNPELRRAIISY